MATPVIPYDKDLPEIPNRRAWEKPTEHLKKKQGNKDEFEIESGRRPSKLLLVNQLRQAAEDWRQNGYPGASSVAERLFNYWFEEDHLVNGQAFRYHFGQREAAEILTYLVEIRKVKDARLLVQTFGEIFYPEGTQQQLPGAGIEHQTSVDGKRQIRRYIPEVSGWTTQDLPAENLGRYAFKMATGSGKTVVMAMLMVWSYFHKRMVAGSELSTNFLLLAPNVIVYQRLEKDFGNNEIFNLLPLIPPEWKSQWNLKVILRGESAEPDPTGNLFLTNIHQVYESREEEWTPANAVEALLGKKPAKDLASQERSMVERIKGLHDLVVLNDEAHHVHDEDLQWHKTLMAIHEALPKGLSLWLDFSATPKDQNGTYFPWIICDYPLAQAVEDRIVKAPLIVHQVKSKDPDKVTRKNVIDAYGAWLRAGLIRWKEHYDTYKSLGPKPVLFIMTEKNDYADEIGKWLVEDKRNGLKEKEVLVIHTDNKGEITNKKEVEKAREVARDIDLPGNKTKVIVSVLMLREGWDVRSVSVVLGLRPMTAKAQILPEQAVGRGLRLMEGISPDRTQTLEVLGTEAFEDFVRQLEGEGVGIKTVVTPPPPPVKVQPVQEKIAYDIGLPITRPFYTRNYKRLSDLDPMSLDPIYNQDDLAEPYRIRLRMEFATTETEVHQADIDEATTLLAQDLLASITLKVIREARLGGGFAELYPLVQKYVMNRCFGKPIDLEKDEIRAHLGRYDLQDGIAKYLARAIGKLTAEQRTLEFENPSFKLSETAPFIWRRNLPLLTCKKTVFNYVATYNDYEKDFGKFLERCLDIVRFASLGTTEQESGTRFKVDYLKSSGAIGFYYPDWVAVEKVSGGNVNWIIETKGREWEDTLAKDAAISEWCRKVSDQVGSRWRYIRVNQSEFGRGNQFSSFEDLIETLGPKKQKGLV
jgi:type III restriction enzyme